MSILIVGAGPVGLCAAIALRLQGCAVTVIDKAQRASRASRALGCQARTMEALSTFGVARDLEAASGRVGTTANFNEHGLIGYLDWHAPDAPFPYTYVAPQTVLEDLLRKRLAGLGVEIGWTRQLERLEQDADGVSAHFTDQSSARHDWLIGADGAHSTVREAAGIDFAGNSTGQSFYLADILVDGAPHDLTALNWMGLHGPLMLMRVSDDPRQWRLFVDVTDAHRTRHSPQEIIDARATGTNPMTVGEVIWESLYEVEVRQAASYRRGRVFLAGDSAHVFPPFGGQGMNTGILDAFNLAWKLAWVTQGKAGPGLLDTYHAERHPIGMQVIAEVEQRRKVFALRNPVARRLRDLFFRLLASSETLERRVSRSASQLTQTYRGRSWLSRQHGRSRVRAGDRAPAFEWQRWRLPHDLSRGFVLLAFSPPDDALPASPLIERMLIVDLENADGAALASRFDAAAGSLVLIRPDGHIGFRSSRFDSVALERYLGGITSGTGSHV